MKRVMSFFVCLFLLISFCGCNTDNNAPSLRYGSYYAVGDYEEMLTPYLWLDADQNKFLLGSGSVVSYAEYGTYEVVDRAIIATSQSTTFRFDIVDKNTLVLIDNGDNEFFKIPVNTQFVFSEVLK